MARKSNNPDMDRLPTLQADGRWHHYWTQDGRQRHVSATSQAECVMAYYQKYKDIDAGLVDVNPNTPVKVWAQQWFETYKADREMTEKSRRMYQEKLNGYILPAIGRYPLRSVTELHLQRILNDSAGMSGSHLKKLRCTMRELFGKAYDLGYIPRNPASGLELPACSERKRRSLTPQEREAFNAICAEGKHRGCLFYQTMLLCGLRPGECAALQWKHISFDRAMLHVEQAKESGCTTVKEPKTASGVRDVPIPPKLLQALKAVQGFPTAPVFPRENGTAHTDDSLRAMWTSWKRQMDRTMAFRLVEKAHAAPDDDAALLLLAIGSATANLGLDVLLFSCLGTIGPAVATLAVTGITGLLMMYLSAKELGGRMPDLVDAPFLVRFAAANAALSGLLFVLRTRLEQAGVQDWLTLLLLCAAYGVTMCALYGRRLLQDLRDISGVSQGRTAR
ncbi:MAG: tyrosine-type recombinase/integrase [Clostridiales bacterium]|nr:tyrosine-type recombinase/integrase [Clostridiales bacterium]